MTLVKANDLGSGNSKSSASSIALTCAAAVPVGQTVLVGYCGSTTTSAVSSITDTKGNTYTVPPGGDVAGTTSRIAAGGSYVTTALTTSDTITVNLAAASGIRCVVATSFTDAVGPVAFDQVKAAAGTSSTPSTGASGATVQSDELVYGVFAVSNATAAGTFTQGSGYTLDQAATTGVVGTNRSLGTEHKVVAATGAQTADGTYLTSMPWDALEVTVKAQLPPIPEFQSVVFSSAQSRAANF